MCFNANKCKVLTVTRKYDDSHYVYCMNRMPLEHVGSFKDLGILVDSSLNWNSHISSIISKTKRVCGMIKRSVGSKAPTNVKLQLYKTLGRPNIEYSSQVWSPSSFSSIKALESVQRSMTKYITGHVDLSYVERCKLLGLLPLSFRREIMDLVFIYKYFNGALDVDLSNIVQFYRCLPSLRSSSQGMRLKPNLAKTETFINSYFNRIVTLWNCLPVELRSSNNILSFRKSLENLYTHKLFEYNPENCCTCITTCRCHICLCQRV